MKINWKQKLTSRKFWAAIIGAGTAVITAFNIKGLTIEQVELIGWGLATLIAYIVGEGLVDAVRVKTGGTTDDTKTD